MPAIFLFLFLLLPLAEIAVFVWVGSALGVGATLALVLLAAFGGLAIVRAQGLAALRRARAALERDELPTAELFNGACLVAAGVFLLIPGFITDFLAVLLTSRRSALACDTGWAAAWARSRQGQGSADL